MSTLCLRLCGPMQSWGTQSRFLMRDTGLEPSKSGVVGLICAAMGTPRDDRATIERLARLKMAVRADRPGTMALDFHTVGGGRAGADRYGVIRADATGVGAVVSRRYYLADAEFMVALEGDRSLLEQAAAAVAAPRWQIFLGRKSFLPSAPLLLPAGPPWESGWSEADLEQSIRSFPCLRLLSETERTGESERLRVVIDDSSGSEVRRDRPLSFAPRAFTIRKVRTLWVDPWWANK
jgi:CRISPR system Cascade subunit CasD